MLESVKLKQEVTQIEEERIQVLNNVEELEQKIKDLDNQMEESVREVGAGDDGALSNHGDVSTPCPYLAADGPRGLWAFHPGCFQSNTQGFHQDA